MQFFFCDERNLFIPQLKLEQLGNDYPTFDFKKSFNFLTGWSWAMENIGRAN